MKISFVIPSYTKTDAHFRMLFNDCIDSLLRHHPKEEDYEIIVCEDGGAQAEQVRLECQRRGIRSIISSYNGGFSKNVNQGIRESTGEIVVLVNNDVQFTKPVTRNIRSSFETGERVGIVGSLLFYPNDTIQHGGIIFVNGGFTHRGWHKTYAQAKEVHHANYMVGCTGALLALKKEMIEEIGLLNERYFFIVRGHGVLFACLDSRLEGLLQSSDLSDSCGRTYSWKDA